MATSSSPDTRSIVDLAAERRRLGVQAIGLVRLRRQVDGGAEAGPALGAAGQPDLPDDRRPVVAEVDVDGHPGPGPGIALEQGLASIVRPSAASVARVADGADSPAVATTISAMSTVRPAADPARAAAAGPGSERGFERRTGTPTRRSGDGTHQGRLRPPDKLRSHASTRSPAQRRTSRIGAIPAECTSDPRDIGAAGHRVVLCTMGPRPMSRRPARRQSPRSPCPRSARSAPSGSIPPSWATSALVVAPPYDVIDPEQRARAGRAPPGQRRPPRPAGRGARRRARRSLPARGPDARRVAFGRDAAQGPASVGLRLRADLSSCRAPQAERTQRGFFARLRLEAFGPDAGVLPHERTLAGPREDRYKLLRATGVNTSPVVGAVRRRVRRDRGAPAPSRPPARPSSRSPMTTASAIACGRWRPTARARPPTSRARSWQQPPTGPVTIADGHHRYETALRYRDERRMTPVVRGGPGVRLPADAVPRGDRRAADGAADPSAGPRDR